MDQVTSESYARLVAILEQFPTAKITLNINACLTEQLLQYGYGDLVRRLGRLAERGQIEFTESAKYHSILPLIPEREARRQIEENFESNRCTFGEVYSPKGFFSPEMCYSRRVAELVWNLGYQWIILDQIAYDGSLEEVPADTLFTIKGIDGFKVFFRDRRMSDNLTFGRIQKSNELLTEIQRSQGNREYLLTATDGEIYGHWCPGLPDLLRDIYATEALTSLTISDLTKLLPQGQAIEPIPSSWASQPEELAQGIWYSMWSHPQNKIHRLQWKLTELAIETISETSREDSGYERARSLTDAGLHSCQYWWASCRPSWSTDMIETGARQLRDAILVLNVSHQSVKEEAQELYHEIMRTVWEWQRSGKARRKAQAYLRHHLVEKREEC